MVYWAIEVCISSEKVISLGMKNIGKTIGLLLALTLVVEAGAQEQLTKYAPFRYEGENGLMESSGRITRNPGQIGNYYVVGDFRSYIIKDDYQIKGDYVMDAIRGRVDQYGDFDAESGTLYLGKESFFHFRKDGHSYLYSASKGLTRLAHAYVAIEPNDQAWSNEVSGGKHFVWALKEDGTYDVLVAEEGFSVVGNLPAFTNYDLIFQVGNDTPMTLTGFALDTQSAIKRTFGQHYGIDESDDVVAVYDLDFKKVGMASYRTEQISNLLQREVVLRGSMLPPPQIRNRVIRPAAKSIQLNDTFSLIPKEGRMVLVNTKEKNKLVLGPAHYDFRYISTTDNVEALLQVRHSESGTLFYFDFNGLFFPKGIPMIPLEYLPTQ